jgi:radical SAM protein with 4Fe4S-binding SPASM domain
VDAFDYADHFLYGLALAREPHRPLQIELHPGLHCDRYRCPHCFGLGQPPISGPPASAADLSRALGEVARHDPLIVVSGVTTEPLTHPEAPAILRAVRERGLRLGLYTKGLRFDRACAEAMLLGSRECYVTFSLDAFNREDYRTLHDIRIGRSERGAFGSGADYFERVLANIRAIYKEKQRRGSHLEIRIAVLLFRENSDPDTIVHSVEALAEIADLVRFAVPQDRNDGFRVGNLPPRPSALLQTLRARFAGHPKVRVLTETFAPARDRSFNHCHTQRFQVTIDKSGNLFPCPQVAVAEYAHLSFGNLRDGALPQLLRSARRRALFDQDVDRDMRCRICDRKDEAINVALGRLERGAFAQAASHMGTLQSPSAGLGGGASGPDEGRYAAE